MAKLVNLVLLLVIGYFLNQEQSVQAKPLLGANFFVLTTRAPTSDSASSLTGRVVNFDLTGYFTRKLSFFMGLVPNGGGLTGKLNFNRLGSTTTTTTEAPESSELPDTSYAPDTTESIVKSTTTRVTTESTSSTTTSSVETVSTTSRYPDQTVRPQPPITTSRTTSSGTTAGSGYVYPTSRPGPAYLPTNKEDASNDIN